MSQISSIRREFLQGLFRGGPRRRRRCHSGVMQSLFRFKPPSVSARAFGLTVGIIFVLNFLAIMPGMGREWLSCLKDRVARAELAILLLPGSSSSGVLNAQTRLMLSRSGTVDISLVTGGAETPVYGAAVPVSGEVDIDRIGPWDCVWRAAKDVLGFGTPYLAVTAGLPFRTDMRIEIVIQQSGMIAHLRKSAGQMLALVTAVAVITGALVYLARYRVLVKPMRVLTANIVALRRDPEYARLSGLKWLSAEGGEEIAEAARELLVMQDELRIALWRNAQLAALGTAVAKTSHDLRNILASALLVAGRFQDNPDPVVKRAANTLVPSIERAVDLMSRAMDSGSGQAPPVICKPVMLRDVVEEAAESVQRGADRIGIENGVRPGLILTLDRNQIFRVLANLLRNAAEAGASLVSVKIEEVEGWANLVVADNGRGLPRKALAALFQPFTGSARNGGTGLGLAIARDLVRAHGGDLLLRKTGPAGTVFVLSLPAMDEPVA